MDLTKVKLEKKGDVVEATPFDQLTVKIIWHTENDFDLACFIEEKPRNGQEQMPTFLYFAETAKGSLTDWPYMMLDGDAGQGDTVDNNDVNEEELTIMRIDQRVSKIHIVAWDYPMVEKSSPARFAESDIRTVVIDNNGKSYDITLDTSDFANACVMATIDCDGSAPKIINRSTSSVLKGFENLQQTYDLCHKS